MGVEGAAWATAASQILGAVELVTTLRLVSKVCMLFCTFFSACFLILTVRRFLKPYHTVNLRWPPIVNMSYFLGAQVKPVLRVPSRQDFAALGSTLGPITAIYMCKNLTYIQLQVLSTDTATHGVRLRVNSASCIAACHQCCSFCCMQLTATVLAPLMLAAHQLLYSLWSLTSFLTVPLEQVKYVLVGEARCRKHRIGTILLLLHELSVNKRC